jgi:hypothetical protein
MRRAYYDINGGLKTALGMFDVDCGRYPTDEEGLKALISAPADGSLTNWRGPYFDSSTLPEDPWVTVMFIIFLASITGPVTTFIRSVQTASARRVKTIPTISGIGRSLGAHGPSILIFCSIRFKQCLWLFLFFS